MQEVTKDVKTGKPLKTVGQVKVPIYDTLDELTAAETPERILSMFNKQNAIRIMGNERAKHQLGRIGKNKRFEIGFELLPTILDDEELRETIGNFDKLNEAIQSKKVQDAIDEYIAESTGEAVEEDIEPTV